jgi:hypothetical protein
MASFLWNVFPKMNIFELKVPVLWLTVEEVTPRY